MKRLRSDDSQRKATTYKEGIVVRAFFVDAAESVDLQPKTVRTVREGILASKKEDRERHLSYRHTRKAFEE